jgi:hypothetical protein
MYEFYTYKELRVLCFVFSPFVSGEGKGKGHPRTGHESPEGE